MGRSRVTNNTVITSPAVEVVTADVEFHIADGKVVFVIVKCRDTLNPSLAHAIADVIAVKDEAA